MRVETVETKIHRIKKCQLFLTYITLKFGHIICISFAIRLSGRKVAIKLIDD